MKVTGYFLSCTPRVMRPGGLELLSTLLRNCQSGAFYRAYIGENQEDDAVGDINYCRIKVRVKVKCIFRWLPRITSYLGAVAR